MVLRPPRKPADSTGRYSLTDIPSDPPAPEDHNALSQSQMERLYRPGMRVPWVVVTTLATALASVLGTYYSTRGAPHDSSPDLHALDTHLAQVDATMVRLETTMSRNADQAHNDTANVATELHAYVNSHAK